MAQRVSLNFPSPVIKRLADEGVAAAGRRRPGPYAKLDSAGLWRQLRNLTFRIEKAQAELGYEPVVNFNESMAAFHNWYAAQSGAGGENWDLLQRLEMGSG